MSATFVTWLNRQIGSRKTEIALRACLHFADSRSGIAACAKISGATTFVSISFVKKTKFCETCAKVSNHPNGITSIARWLESAHVGFEVTGLHSGDAVKSTSTSFQYEIDSSNITHPQSLNFFPVVANRSIAESKLVDRAWFCIELTRYLKRTLFNQYSLLLHFLTFCTRESRGQVLRFRGGKIFASFFSV